MAVQWRRSTHSGGVDDKACVELGRLASGTGNGVRDSKAPDGGHLTLSGAQFAVLIEQVKRRPSR
ncbi:DUF397 domain-containing protein [Actinomadura geliboluensis]|uniref:DUF397 domain-containing protein n=1 Tax=Actinomadura geliboluensis TaxID=882440 RepID=UPI00262A49A5|nr:DUF397 domain-containing protein [Actinomadura geliboluensis]